MERFLTGVNINEGEIGGVWKEFKQGVWDHQTFFQDDLWQSYIERNGEKSWRGRRLRGCFCHSLNKRQWRSRAGCGKGAEVSRMESRDIWKKKGPGAQFWRAGGEWQWRETEAKQSTSSCYICILNSHSLYLIERWIQLTDQTDHISQWFPLKKREISEP